MLDISVTFSLDLYIRLYTQAHWHFQKGSPTFFFKPLKSVSFDSAFLPRAKINRQDSFLGSQYKKKKNKTYVQHIFKKNI